MRIAYFSLDEVNRLLVRRWVLGQGVRVIYPDVRTIGEPRGAGMIIDLDFVPEPYRQNWVGRATAGGVEGPVLVHGHGLTDAEAYRLCRAGMTVCQGRLRRRTLRDWVAGQLPIEHTPVM